MPHVLLYEFLTGGGLLGAAHGPHNVSLRREGVAMLAALAADFAAIDGVTTSVILDSRQDVRVAPWSRCQVVRICEPGGDCAALAEKCRNADWTIVIAPEFDRLLESRLQLVEAAGGRLLGPSSRFAALAADKQRTAEHLAAAGVQAAVGRGVEWTDFLAAVDEIGFPAVIKPLDGAGSQGVRLLADRAAAARLQTDIRGRPALHGSARIERFYPGVAASVAVLCGPARLFPLPPCSQRLSDDGRFRYLGGSCPMEPALAERAVSLAVRAVRSLGEPLGYVGVDLALGNDPDGRDDVVIEINPRMTTSYVGLRAVATSNLAAAMIDVAEGRLPELIFADGCVEFDCDGTARVGVHASACCR